MGNEPIIRLIREANDDNQRNINPRNLLEEQISCPFCKRVFSSTITEFNVHTKRCGLIAMQVNKACELFPASQDYELNKLIYENSKKYSRLYIDKTRDTFDKKIEKLKNFIKKVKINWQDGFCQMNLNRNKLLIESMDQIKTVDLHKELKINFLGEVSYDAGGIMRE